MQAVKILKKSFINFYDDIFKYLLLNMFCFFVIIIPFYLVYLTNYNMSFMIGGIIYLLIVSGPLFLSALKFIRKVYKGRIISYKDFFVLLKSNIKRGIISFLISAVIYIIIIIDFLFFLDRSQNFIMLIFAILFFYIFLLFSMIQIYYWGLMVLQDDEKIITIIKRAFLLVVDNILTTVLIFLAALLILLLNTLLPFIMPFFLFTLISLIMIITSEIILEKYDTK
ncbi:MAG: hypothetical protein ACOCQW_01855 [Halanaerobiaceae bacterium]